MKRFQIGIAVPIILLFAVQLPAIEFPDLNGWEPESDVQTYGPGNLWEVIDGAAEQFLAFGFEEMTMRDIKSGDLTVTVYLYDMGTPLNAFGIYASERGADEQGLAIGTEAILQPPYQALLLKDHVYAKIEAFEGEIDSTNGKAVLKALAYALPGGTDMPDEFRALPRDGRIRGTERYIRESFLGLGDLNECIYAEYKADPEPYRIFYVIKNADELWNTLSTEWQSTTVSGRPVIHRDIPYQGPVGIIKTEKGLFGVTDVKDLDGLKEKLEALVK